MGNSSNGRGVLYAPQRQASIEESARLRGRVEVTQLARELGVTPETVRRDLTTLEQLGKVRRVHGGALPMAETEREPSLLERLSHGCAEKERIARHAVEQLPENGTVLLDSGTTTLAVARAFPTDRELDVVTNSIAIAALFTDYENLRLHMLGGNIRQLTGACVGTWATQALENLNIDVAFIGTNGFDYHAGMSTPNQTEAQAKRAMVRAARRPIVVADSSKAGQVRLHKFAKISDIAVLITDSNLDDETAQQLDTAGMEVIRT